MTTRGRVKGILLEGRDGQEYLLGFSETTSPTLSRRQADGGFETIGDTMAASKVAVRELGLTGPHLIGPGMGKDFFLWHAFREALRSFPPIPSWPTWDS
jgi:hypothetical protein